MVKFLRKNGPLVRAVNVRVLLLERSKVYHCASPLTVVENRGFARGFAIEVFSVIVNYNTTALKGGK